MSVPMKKLPTNHIEVIIGGQEKFQITPSQAKGLRLILREFQAIDDSQESVPAAEVFKEEIKKFSKPGLALRGARQKEDMSQVELAKKLGISQTDLSKMEYGKRPIGKKMAQRLAKILNIDYRVFL